MFSLLSPTSEQFLSPQTKTWHQDEPMQTNLTKIQTYLSLISPNFYLSIIYHWQRPKPFFFVLSLLHNLPPFVKMVYKPLSLTACLGLFFSVKSSMHIKIKILTPNRISIPLILFICL